MNVKKSAGFTIVEVTLFLAISGLMAVMLLAGTGIAIQRQQYREAVVSYEAFLKDQYSKVVNVENNRTGAKSVCGESATTNRGQSDCVVIGRYAVTTADTTEGRVYRTHPVYARETGSGYSYTIDDTQTEEYRMQWGTQSRRADQPTGDAVVSVLMYRDPATSALHVKSSSSRLNNAGISSLIEATPPASSQEICVFDTGWFRGARQSVFINTNVSAGEAFRVGGASEGCNNA